MLSAKFGSIWLSCFRSRLKYEKVNGRTTDAKWWQYLTWPFASGSGYISSITCAPCKTSSDWICVLVAVTNEILKRKSSKCILDLPRVERRELNWSRISFSSLGLPFSTLQHMYNKTILIGWRWRLSKGHNFDKPPGGIAHKFQNVI
jgi:hypothetical protein